jgi:hypothetical protein
VARVALGAAIGTGIVWALTNPVQFRSICTNAQTSIYSAYNSNIRPFFLKHNFAAPELKLPETHYTASITCNVPGAGVYTIVNGKRDSLGTTPLTFDLSGDGTQIFTVNAGKQVQRVSISPSKPAVTVHFTKPRLKPRRQSAPEPVDTGDSMEIGSE